LSTVIKAARNSAIVLAGEAIFRLVSLFIVVYLARYLGPADYGKYNFVFAYIAFFSIISGLGLETILAREISRNKSMAPKLVGNAFIIKLILTALAVLLSIIIISIIGYPPDTTVYVYITTFSLLFISFSDFYAPIFQVHLRMEYSVYARLSFKFISAALILLIIFYQGTLFQIMIALAFAEVIKLLISHFYSRKLVKPQFDIDISLLKYFIMESLPLAFLSVIWVIYSNTDMIMLSFMIGDEAVGYYSAAHKLSDPLSLIPHAVMISLFPIMSESFQISNEKLVKSARLGAKYLFLLTLPIATGIALIANKLIPLIYGESFAISALALQIIIWSLIFGSLNSVFGHLLVSIGKQKLFAASGAICAAVNVVLNFILIPSLSFIGASIATTTTNMVQLTVTFYFVSKYLEVPFFTKDIVKMLISCLVMTGFIFYFNYINLFFIIVLAAIIYFGLLYASRAFSEEDYEIGRRLLGWVGSCVKL
jgi:O-antigen/teichoic acid export membrane protein